MDALEQLYLSDNKLINVDALLCACPNLKILDIAKNRIESIKIESVHLQELWANDNSLASLTDLHVSAPLRTIYLHGNPLSTGSSHQHYHQDLRVMIPTLVHIDN